MFDDLRVCVGSCLTPFSRTWNQKFLFQIICGQSMCDQSVKLLFFFSNSRVYTCSRISDAAECRPVSVDFLLTTHTRALASCPLQIFVLMLIEGSRDQKISARLFEDIFRQNDAYFALVWVFTIMPSTRSVLKICAGLIGLTRTN